MLLRAAMFCVLECRILLRVCCRREVLAVLFLHQDMEVVGARALAVRAEGPARARNADEERARAGKDMVEEGEG